jgi:DNA-directed RNA polymerase subunit RPC12/RpoP
MPTTEMPQQEHHIMSHTGTLESGEDEYYCPTCGRRILLQMDPYKKTVIHAGDDYAIHSGGKGGLMIGAQQVAPSNETQAPDTQRLAEWEGWLQELNFEALWDKD